MKKSLGVVYLLANNNNNSDMDPSMLRVCICNCNTGRFITSITKRDIAYLHDLVTAKVRSAKSPDEIDDEALSVIDVLLDIEEDFDQQQQQQR